MLFEYFVSPGFLRADFLVACFCRDWLESAAFLAPAWAAAMLINEDWIA